MQHKIKRFSGSERLFMALLMLLTGVVSYQLGQESVTTQSQTSSQYSQSAGIIFVEAPEVIPDPTAVPVVASRNGTKYHQLDCPGAGTISAQNLIQFDSVREAQAAGYEPAANCDF